MYFVKYYVAVSLELLANSELGHFIIRILTISGTANCDASTDKAILLYINHAKIYLFEKLPKSPLQQQQKTKKWILHTRSVLENCLCQNV